MLSLGGDPRLVFRPGGGGAALRREEHHVFDLGRVARVEPDRVTLSGYDYTRPRLDLTASAREPSGAGLEVFDHHDRYQEPDATASRAALLLDQLRASAVAARGASACRRLQPGRRFTLAEHETPALDGAYLVTRVEHRGVASGAAGSEAVYENTFAAIGADTCCRPLRPPPEVRQVVETGVVVGPADQEIHTDGLGRIKVRFPWDRRPAGPEHDSCWLRVSQPWAGSGFGAQMIPRIGMEVVVTFLGGDLSRPLVTGCVYNATHPPVFPLPRDQAKSGLRTRSTPGSEGYSELSLDDRAGAERLHVRAQRDFEALVLGDAREAIHGERESTVGADERREVGGALTERVGGDRAVTVGHDLTLSVGHDLTEEARGARRTRVDGAWTVMVGDESRLDVAGEHHARIAQRAEVEVGKEATLAVAEGLTARIGGSLITVVGGLGAKRSWVQHVEGPAEVYAAETLHLESRKRILLTCGQSRILMTESSIELYAPEVHVTGAETTRLSGKKGKLAYAEEAKVEAKAVELETSGAKVVLGSDLALKSGAIKLSSGSGALEDAKKGGEEPPTVLKLVDQDDKPVGLVPFLIKLEDGGEFGGALDAEGEARVDLPGPGRVVFLGVANEWPAPRWVPRVVRPGDDLEYIAARVGCAAEHIWEHPSNAALAKARKPGILGTGDIIHVPAPAEHPGAAMKPHAKNEYKTRIPMKEVAIRFVDEEGAPVAGHACQVDGIGEILTRADGTLHLTLPAKQRQVGITLEDGRRLRYAVGGVEPISAAAGMRLRLGQLGYHGEIEEALAGFARAEGIEGAARREVLARLEERFGC